jgi:hypothetical protein
LKNFKVNNLNIKNFFLNEFYKILNK